MKPNRRGVWNLCNQEVGCRTADHAATGPGIVVAFVASADCPDQSGNVS